MVQGARGESILMVDDQEVRVLFTNRALAEAEKHLGRTMMTLARDASALNMGFGDVATLLRVGMEAARRDSGGQGRPVTQNDAFRVMDAIGFTAASDVVLNGLGTVLAYDPSEDETDGAEAEVNPPA